VRTDIVGWLRLQWDRASAWTCLLAGFVTLFVGWLGVSDTAYTAKQLPYIAGCGLAGLALIGTGAMLWLSADLRDEWRKLDRIEKAIAAHGLDALEFDSPVEHAPRAQSADARSADVARTAVTAGRTS
jgi:hypothetical protein